MHNKIARVFALGLMGAGLIAIDLDLGSRGSGIVPTAFAEEDSLQIDSLSDDPKQFRKQVTQLVGQTDSLIGKLKGKPDQEPIMLDLMQTRDDIMRELPKVDSTPPESQWTAKEMVESVQSKLNLLKDQFEKAMEVES